MIHTVTVAAGDNNYAVVAQQHALEMARRFTARLRIVGAWHLEEAAWGESSEQLMDQKSKEFVEEAKKANIRTEMSRRGEGLLDGLLAETLESDLLIIGMPTAGPSRDEGSPQDSALVEALLKEDLALLRQAECSILVVCRPPRPIETVLVSYQGGLEGKRALNMAGELAERHTAKVVVVSIEGDIASAIQQTTTAAAYLRGFELSSVQAIEQRGAPESEEKILEIAESKKADMLVIGHDPYGILDRLLNRDIVEQIALDTHLPLLIAR